ncbi:MAG: Sua5 family C-terminal domain-containing protein, partial [Opitutaceae bacterium]
RMPSHPLFRRLLKLADVPLAAPSANPFGYISPTTAAHVRLGLGNRIRHILDGGPAKIGLESTIVDLRDPQKPALLRPGAITPSQLERALGTRLAPTRGAKSKRKSGPQLAPGLLARHYSPGTPLILDREMRPTTHPRHAFVFLAKPAGAKRRNIFWLDPHGRLAGVARRLFGLLRALDRTQFDEIHIELAPNEGLGVAINDRLRRAAAR